MSKQNKVPDYSQLRKRLLDDVRIIAEREGLNHFQESFEKGGFTDNAFVAWEPRSADNRPGGAILLDSGTLRDSLFIASSSKKEVVFANDAPYAKIHNEGGRIRAVQYVKAHHNSNFMGTGKRVQIKAHSKKVDITITQRQFMGDSATLMRKMQKEVFEHLENELSKIHNATK